ncbi:MAG: hypothetical protein HC862_16900 [Scytonema sp. RU_4_4]|nr:hypothetical protein [Scytonema sp. RU_4_4]NJR73634.1 hypothetical protein [Scytonema sp. CRU_2_7]
MQDELKNVISQAMNSNSEFGQESISQFAEGELSNEALEEVAGGCCKCHTYKKQTYYNCPKQTYNYKWGCKY